ncbi:MUS81 [Candida pseudojiufengensis]|uniref:MUS81 n=1 Tax=Candida pseudojiufengensis TaxID=497109 RepID=UPI002224EF2F|nr:MUS81 [Candida pseudojiufengensis]KAI5962934.1 MUS81 [Candida pseudojiufengensis]
MSDSEGPPDDFKEYIIKWVEADAIEATKNGSKMAILYNKILMQVKRTDEPIIDTRSLKQIKFIGAKTALTLSNRVVQLCKGNGWEVPIGFLEEAAAYERTLNKIDQTKTTEEESTRPKKRARTTASYVPKHRSGGFAILITLYLKDQAQKGMTRDEICSIATAYCDKSFNTTSTSYHSAWDSIKTIMKKDLVYSTGRSPKRYYLTDEGKELASQLKTAVNIPSSPAQSNPVVNSSFDNGLRLDSTFEKSSPITYKNFDILESTRPQAPVRLYNPAHSSKLVTETLTNKSKTHDAKNRSYEGISYEIWSKDEYEVILFIDNREVRAQQERDFFERKLKGHNVKCDVKALSCGDTVWVARHLKTGKEAVLNYLCERKRIDDLCDSIKDGRYQEQKNRMKKSGMKHCYYLVEEISIVKERVYAIKDSIQTGIAQTMTNAKIYLKRFKDIDETTDFLTSLTRVITEIHKQKNLIIIKPSDISNQEQYIEILNKFREKFEQKSNYECSHLFTNFQEMMGKTSQMTVKEMFVMMLMTIKGCSLEKAIVIQNKFQTPKKLLEYYHSQNASCPADTKKNLMFDEFKNQVGNKKIGKVLSEKIYEVWGV